MILYKKETEKNELVARPAEGRRWFDCGAACDEGTRRRPETTLTRRGRTCLRKTLILFTRCAAVFTPVSF